MKFGDVPANSHGVREYWGYYTGNTTVANSATGTVNFLTFTMPFTGIIVLHAALNGYFSSGGVQNVTASVTAGTAPTAAVPMWARSEGGSSADYWHFTQPVQGYWSSVASGTSLTVGLFISVAGGGRDFIVDWICGTARCFRT